MNTWPAHTSTVVVDNAIAIVVDHIAANLGHGLVFRGTSKSSGHAREHALSARAERSRDTRIASAWIAIVDGSIAIVVEVVTHFGHRSVCLDA